MLHPDKWKYENPKWVSLINQLNYSDSWNDIDLLIHTVANKKPRSSFKPKSDEVVKFDCMNRLSIDKPQTCTRLVLENFQKSTTHERLKQILYSPSYWPMLRKIDFVPFIEPKIVVIIDVFSNLYTGVLPYIRDYVPLHGSQKPPVFVVPNTDEGLAIKERLLSWRIFCKRGTFFHYPWLGKENGCQKLILTEWDDRWYGKKVRKVVLILSRDFHNVESIISKFQRIGEVEILLIPPSFAYKMKNTLRIKNGRWIEDLNLIKLKEFKLVFRQDGNLIQPSNTPICNISTNLPCDLLWSGDGVENKEQIISTDLSSVDSF
jgi:hypothetical protein